MTMQENFVIVRQSVVTDQVKKEADMERWAKEGRNEAAQGRLTQQRVA